MAQSLEALSRQMGSMESIHSVVHTMKTLSVINSAPYEQAARAIEAYHDTVLDALHAFERATGSVTVPAVDAAFRIMIVFGSDHGLCGNYNEVIAGHVAAHLTATAGAYHILCVGAQMADALADRALEVEDVFLPPASVDGLGRLANLLTRHLDQERDSARAQDIAVDLAFFMRSEGQGQAPRIVPLLPLDVALLQDLRLKPWKSRSLPSYTMPSADLFRSLVRAHVFASLVEAAAEAMVTENAARLAMMQQAEQSVEERLDALRSDANALRQSGITTELLDVIIGFEALKSRGPSQRPNSAVGISHHQKTKEERKTP